MGAEMLIHSIGFKAKDRSQIDVKWAKAAFAQARHAIKAIDAARLAEINDAQEGAYVDVQSCRRELRRDLAEVEVAAIGHHRQAAMVPGGGGIILLLAGGMSWGDPPTELFSSMTRLLEAGVLPDARWPDLDPSPVQSTTHK